MPRTEHQLVLKRASYARCRARDPEGTRKKERARKARRLGRPVLSLEERREHFAATAEERAAKSRAAKATWRKARPEKINAIKKASDARRRVENPERFIRQTARQRAWQKRNVESGAAAAKARAQRLADPEKVRAAERAKYARVERGKNQAVKLEVLTHYSPGGVLGCSYGECTEARLSKLNVHHKNHDGREQREAAGIRNGVEQYRLIKAQGFPADLETLCIKHHGWHHGNCRKLARVFTFLPSEAVRVIAVAVRQPGLLRLAPQALPIAA